MACNESSLAASPWCTRLRRWLPGQSLKVPIGFVHITKAGGTAVELELDCPDLRCSGHNVDSWTWERQGMDSLVVIRDPIERFVSNFNYARFGSELHYGSELRLRGKHTYEFSYFGSAGAFIDALAGPDRGVNTSLVTKLAWDAIVKREGGMTFRRQAQWVKNTTPARLHFVCYDAHDMNVRLERALRAAGSNCSVSKLPTINRTGKFVKANDTRKFLALDSTPTENDALTVHREKNKPLTPNQTAWLARQYAPDLKLYREHCGPGSSFGDPAAGPPVVADARWRQGTPRWVTNGWCDPGIEDQWGLCNMSRGFVHELPGTGGKLFFPHADSMARIG